MYKKIIDYIKPKIQKIIGVILIIAAIVTVVDFILRWKIYPYIYNIISIFFKFIFMNLFETLIVIYLILLSIFIYWLYKQLMESKSTALDKRISNIESDIQKQNKANIIYTDKQVKYSESKLDKRIFDLERTVVNFKIEAFKNKGQVGAMAELIEKLKMDKKRGWGVEDTMFEIKEYIKEHGMPHYYISNLNKEIEGCTNDFSLLKQDILKLAQEKLFKVK